MTDRTPPRPPQRTDDLTPLGRAGYLAGLTLRFAAQAAEEVVLRAAEVMLDSRKAFREGKEGRIEDAHIVRETRREPHGGRRR